MTSLDVAFDSTSTNSRPVSPILHATEASPMTAPISRTIPAAVDRGQAYYWSYVWQMGEQESRAELAAGQGKTFDNADDAIRWLLSDDD
jgi:hypothetical protein